MYVGPTLSYTFYLRALSLLVFARCAQGIHEPTTKYGICGIITAVVCFPIGLICLLYVSPPLLPVLVVILPRSTDTEQKCARCGIKL
jgi:peptidoglycan/LPS O-acetylase OafA/YrhL